MNLFEEEAKYPYPILRLADDLERIWARIQRVGITVSSTLFSNTMR